METITVEEAIKRGYTHFLQETESNLQQLKDVTEEDAEIMQKYEHYIVDMTKPKYFKIKDKLISDLLQDYLDTQDEVGDEDGNLSEIVSEFNFKSTTDALNKAFEAIRYFEPIDIRVVYK